jgi:prepilin-type N-terminal cleavage/methylation domain-containing protein
MMSRRKATRALAGFSLVELLIALAVTAMLLVSIAAAFKASVVNFQENEGIFKMVNTARQALVRITNELRTATAVAVGEPSNQCSLITAQGADITYLYDGVAKKLYLVKGGNSYVLCDGVTAMSFQRDVRQDEFGVDFVRSVQISITVSSGNDSRTLAAAALVRRSL